MSENLRVLVVDDDRRMARTLADILTVKGYEAEAAYSAAEALEKAKERHFDCLLTDIKMPEMNGVELHEAIGRVQPDLPVVLMTAYSTDKLVAKGLKEGAIASLTKPLDINQLLSFFSSLRPQGSIVIVDDDPDFARTLGDILRVRDFAVTEITDPHGVAEKLGSDVQVVLLDMKLNDIGGLEVLREIRERYPELPVVLVTGYRDDMARAVEAARKLSAFTCLYKPFRIEELLQVLNEVRKRELSRILAQPAVRGGGSEP